MENFLNATAWTMAEPKPYGLFHIVMLLVGIPVSIALAWKLRRVSDRSYHRILFAIAVILLLSELYKQLFHFYVMDNKTYDWWIPFSAMQSSYVSLCNSSLYEKKQMADSSGNLPDGFQSAWRSYGAAGSGWPHASLYHLDAA